MRKVVHEAVPQKDAGEVIGSMEIVQVYRLMDGQLQLVSLTFMEDWSLSRRREKAQEVLRGQHIVYGALANGEVVGMLMLLPSLDHGRMVIDSFHVSANHRRNGIGRALFEAAKAEAIRRGANALYASACSARETIDFYRAMGFNISSNPIPACAVEEPCDIQMECSI